MPHFNSRPSARGDRRFFQRILRWLKNFNSRPSARGDRSGRRLSRRKRISIHAPPRGATLSAQHPRQQENFNSRPSARGDETKRKNAEAIAISIHAPPRGATPVTAEIAAHHEISIHAPPRGATWRMWRQLKIVAIFQFTPLREGRRDVEYVNYWQIIFQFTPLREGRRDQWGNWVRKIKFQFTPLREGRHCTESRCYSSAISIHAPPRGATARGGKIENAGKYFNSRPSARGDISFIKIM